MAAHVQSVVQPAVSCDQAGALCAGAQASLAEFAARYSSALRRYIQQHLLLPEHPLRRQHDSTDLLQEGLVELAAKVHDGGTFANDQARIGYLHTVFAHRFSDWARKEAPAGGGDKAREVPLNLAAHDRAAPGLGKAEEAEWADSCEAVLAALPAMHRAVVELLCAEYTTQEIAVALNLCQRSVQRYIEEIRAHFAREELP